MSQSVLKLFMFPYVGAHRYSYDSIKSQLGFEVVVYELPGRGMRINEPLLDSFESIVNDAELFFLN